MNDKIGPSGELPSAEGWQPIETAPMNEWLLAWGTFDMQHKPSSIRMLRKVAPNGRGGQYGDFIWAGPDAPHVGQWAEQVVTHWHPLPAKPEPRVAAKPIYFDGEEVDPEELKP